MLVGLGSRRPRRTPRCGMMRRHVMRRVDMLGCLRGHKLRLEDEKEERKAEKNSDGAKLDRLGYGNTHLNNSESIVISLVREVTIGVRMLRKLCLFNYGQRARPVKLMWRN